MNLYEYQKNAVNNVAKAFDQGYHCFNLFFEMGLGKTITAIEIMNNLIDKVSNKPVVVVCPKSLTSMWEYQLSKYAKFRNCWVTTYDQIKVKDKLIDASIVVFDECHRLKNPKSLTHKCIQNRVHAQFILNLTGTPVSKNLMDIYGIMTSWQPFFEGFTQTTFKKRYIDNGGNQRTKELMSIIEPYTVVARLQDNIEMPEYEDIIIPVEMSPGAHILHDSIAHDDIEKPLERIIKMQRLTCALESEKSQLCKQLIIDLIADGNKVVLFTKYQNEFDYFCNAFSELCTGIDGRTKDRDTPVSKFQNNPNTKLFVGNLQTAGLGITLTAATKCIFYSETYNWADAEQARARIYRIGQKNACTYYHLLCRDSIDELIYKNILEKTDLVEAFKKAYENC